MDAASFQFIAFGLLVALVSNFHRSRAWRMAVLLLSSFVFLGLLARNPVVFLPLAGFLGLGYLGVRVIALGWSRAAIWCIAAVIFAFLWLKKYTFLPHGIFLRFPYFTLGLSYVFFRVLHLVIEAGGGGEESKVGVGAYLTYTLNFTTFVSGPIQRYADFAEDQFAAIPISIGPRVLGAQMERLIRGFFKVNVLALVLNMFQTDALAQIALPIPLWPKLFAAFKVATLYPFFLYANFSGYIDIVIAIARLLRLRLPENFDRPFSSSSFIDFWNRWHITLSSWLKNYVFNPLLLTLMRRSPAPSMAPAFGVFAFFVTFFLVGLWHGRTSEFLFFGLLQGGGVAINKIWQLTLARRLGRKGYKSLAANPVYIAFGRGLTFSWFAFSLFWFWSNWQQIRTACAALGAARWVALWGAVWIVATLVFAFWEGLRTRLLAIQTASGPILTSRYAKVIFATVMALLAFATTALIHQPAPDIVYKVF